MSDLPQVTQQVGGRAGCNWRVGSYPLRQDPQTEGSAWGWGSPLHDWGVSQPTSGFCDNQKALWGHLGNPEAGSRGLPARVPVCPRQGLGSEL